MDTATAESAGPPDLGGGREQQVQSQQLLLSRSLADSRGGLLQPRTQDSAQGARSCLPRRCGCMGALSAVERATGYPLSFHVSRP